MSNKSYRLLSVEDNPGDTLLLRSYLAEVEVAQAAGPHYELLTAERLNDALECLKRETPDLLLVDLSLPDGHGVENAQRLRAAAPSIPIIVLTGNNDDAMAVAALQAGAQDYLVKNELDGKLLARAIRYAIERAQILAASSESEERFLSAISAMQEGLILIDAAFTILIFNHSAEQILGLNAAQVIGQSSADLNWEMLYEDGAPMPCAETLLYKALVMGEAQEELTCGIYKPDGTVVWICVSATPLLRPGEAQPYGAVATFSDMTQRRQYEQQLKAQMLLLDEARHNSELQQAELREANAKLETLATTDGLTGLKNHRAFQERLQIEFRRAQRYRMPLSLLMLDVDNFKEYNDTFGHPAGDVILQQVAGLLQENIRDTDFVARYGGEEFVALLINTDYPYANFLAERLRTAIASDTWKGRGITASFGVATLEQKWQSSADFIEAADRALYYSKAQGRNCVTHINDMDKDVADTERQQARSHAI